MNGSSLENVTDAVTFTENLSFPTVSSPHKRSHSPWDDATWILTSSFIIFTMQSGFGLLESGMASKKNEVNIMIKNVVDVIFGGITYWMLGYGLSFGTDPGSNFFFGVGSFFLNPDYSIMGTVYAKFIFQASFATTATTIVSGAMAERVKLPSYILFSALNTFIYCFPAHWMWAETGFLKQLGVIDVAGVGPVHMVGGVTALVAAIMIKPRHGRFSENNQLANSSSVNALLGLFILWWGWLGFNCGSTFGISGGKWKLASRTAATTILASCGGGIASFGLSYLVRNKIFEVSFIINGILGALVAITGICAVTSTWEAIIIGVVGGLVACASDLLLIRLHIDDPVSASPIHLFSSVWGLLSCGIFGHKDTLEYTFSQRSGLLWGGGFLQLGVQTLAMLCIISWSALTSFVCLKLIQLTVGLRVSLENELLGADYVEHKVVSQDLEPNLRPPSAFKNVGNSKDNQAFDLSEGNTAGDAMSSGTGNCDGNVAASSDVVLTKISCQNNVEEAKL